MEMSEEEKIEQEAFELFNCPKNILEYLITSGGSIGPSKLTGKVKTAKKTM